MILVKNTLNSTLFYWPAYPAFLLVIALVISGCSPVSEEDAKQTALSFVKERVKFFAAVNATQMNQSTIPVQTYDYSITSISKESGDYIIGISITSEINSSKKGNSLSLIVDGSSGKVIFFNGVAVLDSQLS